MLLMSIKAVISRDRINLQICSPRQKKKRNETEFDQNGLFVSSNCFIIED